MPNAEFFSQFGEDRLLHELFSAKTTGCCIEVGGNDGIHGSNSYHFDQLGWKTILIEPIPALCAAIRQHRPTATVVECAASDAKGTCEFHVAVGVDSMSTMVDEAARRESIRRLGGEMKSIQVTMRPLDEILQAEEVGEIDFITIDVEGAEMRVLRGLTLGRWRPRILIIEDNSHGQDVTVIDHLRAHGYDNFHRTGVNDWFAAVDDQEMFKKCDPIRFRRLRPWLIRRYQAGIFIKALVPTPLKRVLKRAFGRVSPASGR